MRVGIFSDAYTPNINGVITSIDILKRALEKKGHQVYIVTVNAVERKYSYENRILRIPGIPVGIYDYRLTSICPAKAIKMIKSWNLDIIHSQTEFGIGSFARILAKQFNIPIVHTYHTMYEDMVHYVTKGHFDTSSKKAVEYFAKFYCDKTVNELIVPTKKIYDMFRDKYKVKRNIHIIPTGIEIERFDRKKANPLEIKNIRESLGIQSEDVVTLFIGRIGEEKNIDFLLQAHAQIVKKNPHCKLVITGGGPHKEALEKLTQKLKLTSSVIFTGKVPLKDIHKYYQIADLFATASHSETQGLTVLEALASSLPVLAIQDESFEDAIIDGVNGYFFKTRKQYASMVLELASDKEKREFMAVAARNSAKQHSSAVFASRVLEVYRIAMGESPKPKTILEKIKCIIKGGKQ